MLMAGSAWARLEVTVTGGSEGALPIAIVPFAQSGNPPQNVSAIISADLARSGRFAPMPANQMPGQPHDGKAVDFAKWRGTDSDSLVVGSVAAQGNGFVVKFQLLNVVQGTQLAGYSITTTAAGLRHTAHQIADIVYQKLTGQRGAFDTRLAYITVQRDDKGKPVYRLAVADADGYDEQIILTSPQPLMSPAWSPDGKQLAYVSFEQGHATVYVQSIATGKRQEVAAYPGINSAPAWSPDGKQLALVLSKDGNPNIYVMNLATHKLTQITDSYGIDTEPDWAPDGKSIIFTSDRGGTPQLYRIGYDGSGPVGSPQRLTFEGNYNARASISPDGKEVAMVHRDQGGFQIGILNLATSNLRVISGSRLDESPSFAPNGSMVIYAAEVGGRGVLEVASVDGRTQQQLALSSGDVREPAWSPYITSK